MAGIDINTGAGTVKSSGHRKRRARPNGSSLNASWITAAEDAVSSGPSTADTPQPSSLSSSDLARHPYESNERQSLVAEDEQVALANSDVEHLDAPIGLRPYQPGGLHSSDSSQSIQRPGPSTDMAVDNAIGQSQDISSSRESAVTPGKAKKKRYASQHDAHWLEDAVDSTLPLPHHTIDEAADEPVREPHRPGLHPSTHGRHSVVGGGSTRSPPSNSPSIFRLPHSPHGGSQGYDAPPVVPLVKPSYSPQGVL